MSDTPRIDAVTRQIPESDHYSSLILSVVSAHIARQLEREVNGARELARELRDALEPFVVYAATHGSSNLMGRNGAALKAKDWITAFKASTKAKEALKQ